MKKFLYLFFVLTIIFSSCESDDDANNNSKGSLEFEGKNYDLKTGFIESCLETNNDNLYNCGLNFSTLDIENYAQSFPSTDEKNSYIYFSMLSKSSSGLTEATYIYNNLTEEPLTFNLSTINIDSGILPDGDQHTINSGSIEVSRNNDIYNINFEGTTTEGKNVYMNYRGDLKR